MRRILIALAVLLVCSPVYSQRVRETRRVRNLMPDCTATSGRCPSDNYFCIDSNDIVWQCASPNTWTSSNAAGIRSGATAPSTCSVGELFLLTSDSSGQQLYACESANTWVQNAGAGGLDSTVSSPSAGDLLIYDTTGATFRNKAISGDITITKEGVTTIGANKVALTTDTTGNYVDDATTNGGLELTGTEGATLGMLTTCADTEVLKWSSGSSSWGCATDSGAAGSADVGTVGDCTADPCFTDAGTGNQLSFEGTTTDGFDLTLVAADITTPSKTITLPNETGTVCTTGSVCSGYEASLTNEAGLESATGAINVIVSTEIDTFSEVQTLVADKTLVNEEDAATFDSVMTFSDDPQLASASPQLKFKDTDATAGDVNASILIGCTDTGDGTEDCDVTIEQQIAGTSVGIMKFDADAGAMVDGAADVVQLTVQGHSTQTSDIFVVESSDGATDYIAVSTSGTTFADPGDGNRAIELTENSSACADPATGNQAICALSDGGLHLKMNTGGELVPISPADCTKASGTSPMTVAACSFVNVTGISAVSQIDTCSSDEAGRVLILKFASTADVTDGTGNIQLASNTDWTTIAANDTLTLVCDGSAWYETARSDNS